MLTHPLRNYPFTVFYVGANGIPKPRMIASRSTYNSLYFVTDSGTFLSNNDIFITEAEAWNAGAARLSERQERITKAQKALDKHVQTFAAKRPAR